MKNKLNSYRDLKQNKEMYYNQKELIEIFRGNYLNIVKKFLIMRKGELIEVYQIT